MLLCAMAFAALSCEPEEKQEKTEESVPEISVLTTEFPSISDAGGTMEISITANAAWSVSVSEDWLSISPASGEAGEQVSITLTAEPNETPDRRSATVTVSCSNSKGEASEEFVVYQKQKNALILSDDVIPVSYEGETISVTLRANSDVSYEIAEDAKAWIVPVPSSKALVDFSFQFEVLANDKKEEREGVITFTNLAGSETVTVKQAPLPEPDPEIEVSPASAPNVSVEGESIKLALSSNMPWVATLEEGVEWIAVSPEKGEAGENQEISLTVLANPGNDSRSADITFTCTNAENESKSVTVKITQMGLNIPFDIHISSAAELIQFAVEFNSGNYDPVMDMLTVTLDADITFDEETSAAFNATGGIGCRINNSSHPFGGRFFGCGHSIGGLNATVPIFPFISKSGSVSNLSILNTCSFTFTRDMTKRAIYLGALAGSTSANIDSVSVAANIVLSKSLDNECETAVGGVVGMINGNSVKECSYSGNLSASSSFETTQRVMLGGIVGLINSGSIINSHFDGTMSNEAKIDQCDSLYKTVPLLAMGGIAGYNSRGGQITGCVANDNAKKITGSYEGSSGTLVNKTEMTWNCAVAGIVGENNEGTVSGCTNKAYILNTVFKSENRDSSARYLRIGGIAGINRKDGTITGSNNEGQLTNRSNPRLQSVGGVAGQNYGTITSCSNKADLAIATSGTGSYSARLPYFGGVIGENLDGSISDVHNSGTLTISRTENTTGVDVRFGGVIGSNQVEVDGGSSKSITNTGKVYFNTNISSKVIKYCLGGIAGYSSASIKGVENKGYVLFNWNSTSNVGQLAYLGGVVGYMEGKGQYELDNCVNTGGESNGGEVDLKVASGAAKHTNNYVGGILGYTVADVAIKNCSNSGYVHGGNATKQNGTSCYVGGIAGYLAGNSSITKCVNSGDANNNHSSNSTGESNTAYSGGIAGQVIGTADKHIVISECEHNTVALHSRRGYMGGIVGYAKYADISNSNNKGTNLSGSAYYAGGIAGTLINSTATNCNMTGTTIKTTQMQSAGGIVAKLGAESVLDGCSSSVNLIDLDGNGTDGIAYHYAAVAGDSVEGSTIQNCHYPATGSIPDVDLYDSKSNYVRTMNFTWQICSDSNFKGEGNLADVE